MLQGIVLVQRDITTGRARARVDLAGEEGIQSRGGATTPRMGTTRANVGVRSFWQAAIRKLYRRQQRKCTAPGMTQLAAACRSERHGHERLVLGGQGASSRDSELPQMP